MLLFEASIAKFHVADFGGFGECRGLVNSGGAWLPRVHRAHKLNV
jgi:hypothetical protein